MRTTEIGKLAGAEVIEEEVVGGSTVRRRGIYLLPNLFTTASLFSGFYAIVAAANGMYENGAIAIFVSMILDGLDGRVARLTTPRASSVRSTTAWRTWWHLVWRLVWWRFSGLSMAWENLAGP